MNSVVLFESQGSCALVRIVRLQKFDRRDNMIFTVHLNRLIDENTPLEQSTIETCLQEAYKYQKVGRVRSIVNYDIFYGIFLRGFANFCAVSNSVIYDRALLW